MIRKLVKKLFYNPYRAAKRDSRIRIHADTILLGGTQFDFRGKGGEVAIGESSMVEANFIFESDEGKIEVGARTYIGGGTKIISRSKIEIGSDVTIGWGVYLYDHNSHSLDYRERMNDIRVQNECYRRGESLGNNKNWAVVKSAPIVVGDKAWIGFEAVILKGVTIGEGAVVAARSVVTKDVEPWAIVAGNPAMPVGKV